MTSDVFDYAGDKKNQPESTLLPHYVYILLNPIDQNNPFYVGVGSGKRGENHEAEVRRELNAIESELDNSTDATQLSEKKKVIKNIIDSGQSPYVLVIGRYEMREEALAVESTLIKFVYGFHELTNAIHGHGERFIRPKNNFEDIPGIDIPKTATHDLSYRNSKIGKLTEAGAYEYLEEIKKALTRHKFNWREFETPEDMRFHPGESNGYIAVIVRIGNLDIRVQTTASRKPSIQLIFTEATDSEEGTQDQHRLLDHIGFDEFDPKAGRIYAWIDKPSEKFTVEGLIKRLKGFEICLSSQA